MLPNGRAHLTTPRNVDSSGAPTLHGSRITPSLLPNRRAREATSHPYEAEAGFIRRMSVPPRRARLRRAGTRLAPVDCRPCPKLPETRPDSDIPNGRHPGSNSAAPKYQEDPKAWLTALEPDAAQQNPSGNNHCPPISPTNQARRVPQGQIAHGETPRRRAGPGSRVPCVRGSTSTAGRHPTSRYHGTFSRASRRFPSSERSGVRSNPTSDDDGQALRRRIHHSWLDLRVSVSLRLGGKSRSRFRPYSEIVTSR
jgi:hypothetical protein